MSNTPAPVKRTASPVQDEPEKRPRTGSPPPAAAPASTAAPVSAPAPAQPSAATSAAAPPAPPAPVYVLRHKLHFRQKNIQWDRSREVMMALLEFSDLLAQASAPLECVPERFLPLIGLLGEESDKPLPDVARAAHASIVTSMLASDPDLEQATGEARLPFATVLAALEIAGQRVDYGLSPADVRACASPSVASAAVSADLGVSIYRFEIQPPVWDALSEELRHRLTTRRAERREAQAQCGALFATLPESEQALLIFGSKKKAAAALAQAHVQTQTQAQAQAQAQTLSDPTAHPTQAGAVEAPTEPDPAPPNSTPLPGTPRKPPSASPRSPSPAPVRQSRSPSPKLSEEKQAELEEKERLKAERAEQRAAKDRARQAKLAEKERVQANQQRQANFLAGFLGRKKPAAGSQTPEKASPEHNPSPPQGPQGAFERTFLPCVIRNLAPANRFASRVKPVDDVTCLINSQPTASSEELLADWGHSMPSPVQIRSSEGKDPDGRLASGVQSSVSVREVMHLVRESDILGEGAAEAASAGLAKLRDVQMKYVLFHTDLRPGWVGTWTRSTAVVGPRTPYGQDLVQLDYALDSDAEWEAPEEGEGEEIADEDEEDAESENSEFDDSDWLEDDMAETGDGDGAEEAVSESERDSPSPTKPVPAKPKIGAWKRDLSKRAWGVIKKLVPYASSVHWETELGACDSAFQSFQLTFFPGFSLGIDPFAPLSKPEPAPGPELDDPPGGLARSKKSSFPEELTDRFVAALYAASNRSNRGSLTEELFNLFVGQGKAAGQALTRVAVDRKLDEVAVKRGKVYVARPEFEHLAPPSVLTPAESG